MNLVKKIALVFVTSAFLAGGLAGCEKKEPTPGEQLDKAIDKTKEAVKEAGK